MRRICVLFLMWLWLFAAVAWGSTSAIRAVAASGRSPDQNFTRTCAKSTRKRGAGSNGRQCPTSPRLVLFGDQAVEHGIRGNAAGLADAFPFRSRGNGTASALAVYVDAHNDASRIVTGVYADAGHRPGSLLTTGSLERPKRGAWNAVTLPGAAVRKGGTYWLVVMGEGGTVYFRDRPTEGCASETSSQRDLKTLPISWTMGVRWRTCSISAYVSGVARGTLTLTHAPIAITPVATAAAGTATPSPATGTSTGTSTTSLSSLLPPVNIGAPVVAGSTAEGDTLTVSNGSWLDDPTTYAYQWEDCNGSGGSCFEYCGGDV